MRQVARKGLITVAAASGMLAITGGYAHADAGAKGLTEEASGLLTGNVVQAPVHVPVNICGNTVNVLGALNPAAGNDCATRSGGSAGDSGSDETAGDSGTTGLSNESEGTGSGNVIQLPIEAPVNLCGNNIGLASLDNLSADNGCAQGTTLQGGDSPETPGDEEEGDSPNTPDTDGTSGEQVELAETGTSSGLTGVALPAGAALVLGGAVLFRRSRAASRS
ncbi:chaplin [Streptomyces meridianus]|uniref:Chaplin n=1 Tax=Streptomyces meridianus TaxID=2938945 RepID=A0ABT0X6U9_9ACTN|nr:chaplin [Streptomyces meridianus]MCM2578247.1 chaplin [Streptomyces meridianus]